jgi:hypothetical protein
LLKTIKKEGEAKSALKEATKAKDLKKLEAALATAAKLKVMDSSEAKEATATKARIEEINKTAAALEKAIGKGDEAATTKLMETMVGLGAKDHAMVAKGETVTKAAAKASKHKQKEMDDVEAALKDAIKKQDLEQLMELEIKVRTRYNVRVCTHFFALNFHRRLKHKNRCRSSHVTYCTPRNNKVD